MAKVNKLKEKVSDKLSIPKDIVLNMPVIKVIGDREVIIENHKGILEYTSSSIKLKSVLGDLTLIGKGFQIKDISEDNIFIVGLIDSLSFNKS